MDKLITLQIVDQLRLKLSKRVELIWIDKDEYTFLVYESTDVYKKVTVDTREADVNGIVNSVIYALANDKYQEELQKDIDRAVSKVIKES